MSRKLGRKFLEICFELIESLTTPSKPSLRHPRIEFPMQLTIKSDIGVGRKKNMNEKKEISDGEGEDQSQATESGANRGARKVRRDGQGSLEKAERRIKTAEQKLREAEEDFQTVTQTVNRRRERIEAARKLSKAGKKSNSDAQPED